MAGIDIRVHRSDRRARVGKLNRQGSPQLRWALYEAALAACRPSSPDHADYLALKARGLSHTRASRNSRGSPTTSCASSDPTLWNRSRPADQRARSVRPTLCDERSTSGQLPQLSRLPPEDGGPPKTERPESLHPD
jgi:Transposase IS116/IS110/IS902 family